MRRGIALLALLSTLPVTASSIPLEQALEVCRAETNALRRLGCYDAISADGLPARTSTQAQVAAPAAAAPQAQNDGNQFGLEHHKAEVADEMTVVVKAIRYTPHKALIIDFTNGQTWQQVGADYYKIAVGETHVIKRGVLNSFMLGSEQSNRTIRVKREK